MSAALCRGFSSRNKGGRTDLGSAADVEPGNLVVGGNMMPRDETGGLPANCSWPESLKETIFCWGTSSLWTGSSTSASGLASPAEFPSVVLDLSSTSTSRELQDCLFGRKNKEMELRMLVLGLRSRNFLDSDLRGDIQRAWVTLRTRYWRVLFLAASLFSIRISTDLPRGSDHIMRGWRLVLMERSIAGDLG